MLGAGSWMKKEVPSGDGRSKAGNAAQQHQKPSSFAACQIARQNAKKNVQRCCNANFRLFS